MDFFKGRQAPYMWDDLNQQFREPSKYSLSPVNLTKEIINAISILYRNKPIRNVIGTQSDKKLWEELEKEMNLDATMKRVDALTRFLGTINLKVSVRDEKSGVSKTKSDGGKIVLDIVKPDSIDVVYKDNPKFLDAVVMGNGSYFTGFAGSEELKEWAFNNPGEEEAKIATRIYWSRDEHRTENGSGEVLEEGPNPYGIIPVVTYWNTEPDSEFFLPVDEPLIYANHAINMRLLDLNHISKFQAFGIPVFKGLERGTSIQRGRPVDDFNQLQGAGKFKFGSNINRGPTGRTNSAIRGYGDANAYSNSTGVSFAPDVGISTGPDGDFKFEHPKADLNGLIAVISNQIDWLRQTYGLAGKSLSLKKSPSSGFSLLMEKIGVIEDLGDRQELFRPSDEKLFEVVKEVWNKHHSDRQFSKDSKLQITYRTPNFPSDPLDQINLIREKLEQGFMTELDAFKELYPHLTEKEIKVLMTQIQKEKEDKIERALQHQVKQKEAMGTGEESSEDPEKDPNNPDQKFDPESEDGLPLDRESKSDESKKKSVQPRRNLDFRKPK